MSPPPQVARLRGGVKRAAVKADDEDDEDEDDEVDSGSRVSSFVTGTFKNVSPVARLRVAAAFTYRRSRAMSAGGCLGFEIFQTTIAR